MDQRRPDIETLVDLSRDGDRRSLARLLSLVEGQDDSVAQVTGLTNERPTAHVIGITGPPGAGKSTSTSALTAEFRRLGRRVGILAVDPSSPFSGGAVLGDRVRMQRHAHDGGVYIRSLSTRGHLGGLSVSTSHAIRLLEHARFDIVIVETVGVGQSEVDITTLADTTIVLLAPGLGDSVQAAKAGILEIGDVFVVNKADRDGAEAVRRDLRNMIHLNNYAAGDWKPPICMTVAPQNEGLDDLRLRLDEHWTWLTTSGSIVERRRRRAASEVRSLASAEIRRLWDQPDARELLGRVADDVAAHGKDPFRAMREFLSGSLFPLPPVSSGRRRGLKPK